MKMKLISEMDVSLRMLLLIFMAQLSPTPLNCWNPVSRNCTVPLSKMSFGRQNCLNDLLSFRSTPGGTPKSFSFCIAYFDLECSGYLLGNPKFACTQILPPFGNHALRFATSKAVYWSPHKRVVEFSDPPTDLLVPPAVLYVHSL